MSNPFPYLVRMLMFLVAVAGLGLRAAPRPDPRLHEHADARRRDPGVLVLGILFVMRQVISLWPEVKWLRRFQRRADDEPPRRPRR